MNHRQLFVFCDYYTIIVKNDVFCSMEYLSIMILVENTMKIW